MLPRLIVALVAMSQARSESLESMLTNIIRDHEEQKVDHGKSSRRLVQTCDQLAAKKAKAEQRYAREVSNANDKFSREVSTADKHERDLAVAAARLARVVDEWADQCLTCEQWCQVFDPSYAPCIEEICTGINVIN